jgi:hypothetical protein
VVYGCTARLISGLAADYRKGRVRLTAPGPFYSGRLQRLRDFSYKEVLQGPTPWLATKFGTVTPVEVYSPFKRYAVGSNPTRPTI